MQVNYVCLDKKEIDTDSYHGISIYLEENILSLISRIFKILFDPRFLRCFSR